MLTTVIRRRRLLLRAGECALFAALLLPQVAGGDYRVVGGGPANAEGWQLAVALKLRHSHFFCGGTLIAPNQVLTAAHCVKKTKRRKLLVATGTPWLSGRNAAPRIPVSRIRIHPDYNGEKVFHDAAVVTLARPSTATPVLLPTFTESKAATKPGDIVRVAGWGSRSAYGKREAKRLKAVRERVYRPRKCQRSFKKGGFNGRSMICAIGPRVRRFHGRRHFRATDCFGDSGGPLVASTPGGPRIVGIVSFGSDTCGLGSASAYTRVSYVLPFIRRVMGQP